MIHHLLSVRCLTTDNNRFVEFNPWGLTIHTLPLMSCSLDVTALTPYTLFAFLPHLPPPVLPHPMPSSLLPLLPLGTTVSTIPTTTSFLEALHTATHLLNRLPSKAVRHPTPYFALYGTDPSYDHLRVFGCACYPNTSATAPHKLSPRSTRCLFLGYSPDHKGYRCLDLASHRIIISRHVVFDEDVFPLANSSPPTDLDSILESDLSTHSPQAPRLAPLPVPCAASPSLRAASLTPLVHHAAPTPPLALIPAPRAAPSPALAPHVAPSTLPAPRATPSTPPVPRMAPSTPPAPRAASTTLAPSTSGTCFADPALVYRCRGSAPPSVPTDPGPSTRAVRFADPAVVYHRRESATPVAPAVSAPRSEPSVYHPDAIHCEPEHIHPMLTRHAAGVLWPVDRLILAADMTNTPPDASPVPSPVRTALADPH
jgi:hypothetical protein